jgi:hypothetical protein
MAQDGRSSPLDRRVALVLLAAGALALAAGARVRAATLPAPGSLASALGAAVYARQPLLVLASTAGCPFCQMVRDNYLAPLQRDGHLPVVQLDLGNRDGVIDFAGNASTHDALLRGWHVDVAPTVLFFGRGGREVAPRLVGASRDFYGAYLEQRLETARRNLG